MGNTWGYSSLPTGKVGGQPVPLVPPSIDVLACQPVGFEIVQIAKKQDFIKMFRFWRIIRYSSPRAKKLGECQCVCRWGGAKWPWGRGWGNASIPHPPRVDAPAWSYVLREKYKKIAILRCLKFVAVRGMAGVIWFSPRPNIRSLAYYPIWSQPNVPEKPAIIFGL